MNDYVIISKSYIDTLQEYAAYVREKSKDTSEVNLKIGLPELLGHISALPHILEATKGHLEFCRDIGVMSEELKSWSDKVSDTIKGAIK